MRAIAQDNDSWQCPVVDRGSFYYEQLPGRQIRWGLAVSPLPTTELIELTKPFSIRTE
jgi:hypothetical protein